MIRIRPTASLSSLLAVLLAASPVAGQLREDLRQEDDQPPRKRQLTKPPKLLQFVPAKYPPEAQRQGIAGPVEMVLAIDARGAVSGVEVVKAPSEALAAAAKAAALRFRFSPAEIDGEPAPIRARYTYRFVLEQRFSPRLPDWMQDRSQAKAGDDVLVGRVRELGTRLPIPGAAVVVRAYGIEVKADGRGNFAVPDMPAGKVEVEAISLEHKKETVQVEVREGEQTRVTFYLPPLQENPYETVVRGKRPQTTVTRVTLRGKQLTTVPGTFGDPVRVIENLPGLARVPYVGGALLVRGAAPNDSGVFLDAIRIPLIYHFLGGPSVLNPQFLDRIDYYPGNADVRYGRLTAGVVDVATADAFTEQLRGSVDINLLNASVFLATPVSERVSVAGAVRRSYIDALLPSILDAAGQEATTVVPVYYDYQLRVDAKLAGDDRLFVLAFGSDDDLEVSSNEEDNDFAIDLGSRISFHRLLAQWRAQLTPTLRSRLQPFVGVNIVSLDAGDATVEITSWTTGLREDLELELGKRVTLRFGLDVEAIYSTFIAEIPVPVNYRNPTAPTSRAPQPGAVGNQLSGDVQPVEIDQWLGGVGAYVDAVINASDRLQLIPGLRTGLTFYFGNTRPVVDPRLTVRYKLREPTTLKAAAGMFSAAPPPNQANETFGNPELQLEHAAHFSLGVEQQFTDALKVDAQLYWIQRWDQAIRTDRVRFVDGQPDPLFFVNSGRGRSFGLELLAKHEVTRNFYGWLSYTLSRSEQRFRDGGEIIRFIFDQTHLLTLVGSYRFGAGWEAGLRFRLASGRPETPILGGVFNSDADIYERVTGELRSTSRPLFHQLDLRIEKTWFFKLWRLAVYLDVQNVYNAENPEATLYDYRFRESGPLRGLPILPTFGVKGSF